MEITIFSIIVILILVAIGSLVDKRKGLGAYAYYGPHSNRKQRVEIDKGIPTYLRGLKLYMEEEQEDEAVACWKEAERHGLGIASTCLGVDAYERDRPALAQKYWKRAAARGEVTAKMFLKSLDFFGKEEFVAIYRNFMHAEAYGDEESRTLLIGLALKCGYIDYAKRLRHKIRIDEERRTRSRFQY